MFAPGKKFGKFNTMPQRPGEPGNENLGVRSVASNRQRQKNRLVWTQFTVDADVGWCHLPGGRPHIDFYCGAHRPGRTSVRGAHSLGLRRSKNRVPAQVLAFPLSCSHPDLELLHFRSAPIFLPTSNHRQQAGRSKPVGSAGKPGIPLTFLESR